MRKLLITLAFSTVLTPLASFAQSAPEYANVVASCGTVNGASYAAGTNRPVTIDTSGRPCPGSSSPVTGTVTANQGTPNVGGVSAWPVISVPSAVAGSGVPPVQSSALETGHVIKASAGNLYDFNVSADATLSAAAWAIMVFNATTVPAAGAVTPVKCILLPAGATGYTGAFPTPLYLSTGISVAVSIGQTCFTKTDSAHGFISADAQ